MRILLIVENTVGLRLSDRIAEHDGSENWIVRIINRSPLILLFCLSDAGKHL